MESFGTRAISTELSLPLASKQKVTGVVSDGSGTVYVSIWRTMATGPCPASRSCAKRGAAHGKEGRDAAEWWNPWQTGLQSFPATGLSRGSSTCINVSWQPAARSTSNSKSEQQGT